MGVINDPAVFKQADRELFSLDGLIERRADGWYWMTGEHEPRLMDLPVRFFAPDFRGTDIDDETYIVIPEGFELVMEWDGTPATHSLIRKCVEEAGQETMVPFAAYAKEPDEHAPQQVPGWIVPKKFWDSVMDNPANLFPGWKEADFEGLFETANRVAMRLAQERSNVVSISAGKVFP